MINRFKHFFSKWFSPVMVGGYRRLSDRKILPNIRISNTTYIQTPKSLDIDDHVFIGHFNFIDASNGLKIGEGCQITSYVSILTHSSHISIRLYGRKYVETKNKHGYLKGNVIIGPYSFIGPHCVIMPGTSLGKGSMVAAFSYVKGHFPDFAIISGNPAKIVGDTRDIDQTFLDEYPELKNYYSEWVDVDFSTRVKKSADNP